jgi:hypothetical protein
MIEEGVLLLRANLLRKKLGNCFNTCETTGFRKFLSLENQQHLEVSNDIELGSIFGVEYSYL